MKIVLIILLIAGSTNVVARQCWGDVVESEIARETGKSVLQLQLESAEYIFVAEALTTIKTVIQSKGEEPGIARIITEFLVEDFLKGKGSGKVTVEGRFGCGCHYDFTPGVNYLVFASEEKETGRGFKC